MTNKIEIRDVTKTFKEGDILKNVSFTAEEGEVTAFLVWIGHLQELL